MVATDRPVGGRTDREQVVVNLIRDTGPPTFSQLSYTVTIPETQAVNSTILRTITATDTDLQV